jgi:flagellar biosynthesis/type III secretory pathway protein FliH
MKTLLIVASALLLVNGCMQAEDPKNVAQQYWQAMQAGDTTTARTLVSAESQAAFDEYAALPDENKITLNAVALTESRTVVTTIINSGNTSKQFDTVLVLQNGQWVVDADQSRVPAPPTDIEKHLNEMADKFSSTAEKNLDQLEESLDEGMQMLDKFMQEGSKEMGESFNKGMKDFNKSLNEALEKLKQRREKEQAPPPAPAGDGEGMI